MSKTDKANQLKKEITARRQLKLDVLTAYGKSPSIDFVWESMQADGLVDNCTLSSFRDSIYKHNMGIKEGKIYDRRLTLGKPKSKRKRYPPKPALPLHKLTALEMAYNKASRLMNGFNRTLLPEEYEA